MHISFSPPGCPFPLPGIRKAWHRAQMAQKLLSGPRMRSNRVIGDFFIFLYFLFLLRIIVIHVSMNELALRSLRFKNGIEWFCPQTITQGLIF